MFSNILKKIVSIMTRITGFLFLVVLLVTVTNILLRNVLSVSWLFMSGLLRLSFIWMVFTGTAVLYYNNDHLIMDFFSGKFSVKWHKIVDVFEQILFLLFCAVLVFYGIQVTKVRMGIPFETWKVPTGYAFVAVPVNGFIMALFSIEKLMKMRSNSDD
jgi:TRAP-type C4-dicarboxylate transport system permease small subunit